MNQRYGLTRNWGTTLRLSPKSGSPYLGSATFRQLNRNLVQSNRLLTRKNRFLTLSKRYVDWPTGHPHTWDPDIARARSLREITMHSAVNEIVKRKPHLEPFSYIRYDPEHFKRFRSDRDAKTRRFSYVSGMWDDRNEVIVLNDRAFTSPSKLCTVITHEMSHGIQHKHPRIYKGRPDPRTGKDDAWHFREFDAYLRNAEDSFFRNPFMLSPLQKGAVKLSLDYHYEKARASAHWNRLARDRDSRNNFMPGGRIVVKSLTERKRHVDAAYHRKSLFGAPYR